MQKTTTKGVLEWVQQHSCLQEADQHRSPRPEREERCFVRVWWIHNLYASIVAAYKGIQNGFLKA